MFYEKLRDKSTLSQPEPDFPTENQPKTINFILDR